MKNYLYVMYNKLSGRYETVFCFPSDSFAIKQCEKMKVPADEYDICRVGSIDISTGIIEAEAPVRLVLQSSSSELPTTQAD